MNDWCAFELNPGLSSMVCSRVLDPHHCIPQQTIKAHYSRHAYLLSIDAEVEVRTLPPLEDALADRRNLLPLCRHHHDLVTRAMMYVTRPMLPEGIDDFVAELGLGWYMARTFDRDEAA